MANGNIPPKTRTELGPQSISLLCPVPRRETWLEWGVPRTVLGIQAEQRQAWNRHYSCLPQSLYKILPEKRERKGPSLSLLLRQGKGRRGKLPFSSLRQEGSQGLCCCPVPCSQKLEEGEGAALPQFKVKVTCTTSWYLLVLQPECR